MNNIVQFENSSEPSRSLLDAVKQIIVDQGATDYWDALDKMRETNHPEHNNFRFIGVLAGLLDEDTFEKKGLTD